MLEQPFWEPGTACWRHLVSVGVRCWPELSRDTWRRCLCANVYAYVDAREKMFIGFRCDSGCIEVFSPGLVWCSHCFIMERLQKAKLHKPDTFETSKYQNLPISSLKNILLLLLLKFLGPSEENYNPPCSYRNPLIRPQTLPKIANWGQKRKELGYFKMAPQVQPKCFWHAQHKINYRQLKKMGLSQHVWSQGGSTLKKKDTKQPFFPPCTNWPICIVR